MLTVLVTGASGFIGAAVCRRLASRGAVVHAGSAAHPERVPIDEGDVRLLHLDLAGPKALEATIAHLRPAAVVHLGAMSAPGACERDPPHAERINVVATATIAQTCLDTGAAMLFASTDQVFAGEHGMYTETDSAKPLHVYGRTKLAAESKVSTLGKRGLSLRISLTYGASPAGDRSASEQIVNQLARGEAPRLFTDEIRSPILVNDLAEAIGELVERMAAGDAIVPADAPRVLHLGGPDALSRFEFGEHLAGAFGLDASRLQPVRQRDVPLGYDRPRDVSLDSSQATRKLDTTIRSAQDGLAFLQCQHRPVDDATVTRRFR